MDGWMGGLMEGRMDGYARLGCDVMGWDGMDQRHLDRPTAGIADFIAVRADSVIV